ncbi:MAG TPA: hypothetical protein PKE38_18215, partial [Ignavibacteriaceae bacterium]|nr:hypothetical protein [Ignavibacteriaceae bacterium]
MKKNYALLLVLIFSFFAFMHVQGKELENDQNIVSILNSDEFVNTLINYQFEGNQYSIRLIYNPKKETLWGNHLSTPTSLSLILIAKAPILLSRHLEDLVLEQLGTFNGCYFSLNYGVPKNWELIWPVHIATDLKDLINDEIVQNTFLSANFENRIIYYFLENQYYQVRLLQNPEKRKFSATKKFRLETDFPLRNYSFSWDKKHAIIIDKNAPQELINHLSSFLGHLSYWDWYFNFSLANGTYVEYVIDSGSYTTTYKLDTWFNYTESF